MKRGDIIIVTHGELGRPRPAVVVQTDELGPSTTTVLICPITSELMPRLPIRPVIEASAENGLHVRSQIMTDKALAVPRERVRSIIGALDSTTTDQLNRALLVIFGLAR